VVFESAKPAPSAAVLNWLEAQIPLSLAISVLTLGGIAVVDYGVSDGVCDPDERFGAGEEQHRDCQR
jgi:hypothetical protein